MPVKNTGAYLDICLASIVAQSYSNWELIAINDHSSDSSKDILEKWSSKDPRIHCFDNLSRGIIPALKLAFSYANGQLIHRMDSDDIMMPRKLELLFRESEKTGLSTAKVKYFSPRLRDGYKKYEAWINDNSSHDYWSDIYYESVLPSPCWLMTHSIFKEYIEHPDLQYPEDYFLSFFLYSKNIPPAVSKNYLHLWRDHSERASRNDPNYEDQSFLDLKVFFFQKQDYDHHKTLVLWGAGKKGKNLAKLLKLYQIPFLWLTNNPKKIGLKIYGHRLENINDFDLNPMDYQVILSISNPREKAKSILGLEQVGFNLGRTLFCFF